MFIKSQSTQKEVSLHWVFLSYVTHIYGKLYICWLDSCRVPRKYKNAMQGTTFFAGEAGLKVTSRPHFDTRRATGKREVTFKPAGPGLKNVVPCNAFLY